MKRAWKENKEQSINSSGQKGKHVWRHHPTKSSDSISQSYLKHVLQNTPGEGKGFQRNATMTRKAYPTASLRLYSLYG